MKLSPKPLSSCFLSPVHILRGDQPTFQRPQRQETTCYHQWQRREQVNPPRRIESDLYPNDDKGQWKRDDTKREERWAVIGGSEPVIQTANLTPVRYFQP